MIIDENKTNLHKTTMGIKDGEAADKTRTWANHAKKLTTKTEKLWKQNHYMFQPYCFSLYLQLKVTNVVVH